MQSTAEEWRPVPGYEALYEVSNRGKVKSLGRVLDSGRRIAPRELRRSRKPLGYKQVVLIDENGAKKTRPVHQLVLEAFVGPMPPGMECCHWDGDPGNNRVENLRWDTPKANADDLVRYGTPGTDTWRLGKDDSCRRGHELIPDNIHTIKDLQVCRACWNAHQYHRQYGLDEDSRAHLADIEFEFIKSGARPRPAPIKRLVRRKSPSVRKCE